MDEKQLKRAMNLISVAGTAKSMCIDAMNQAEKGSIDEARTTLKTAKKTLHEAHNIQTQWMTDEMNGEKVEKTIMLIHSQDHFMSADIMMTVAEKVINLHAEITQLKKEQVNE
ncbi:PTS lactose/cellobiose transporter subunit IIA [Companilactobacillus alimentarius]|uniref:PTS cellobiose transporter subunit IIA n=1 Tax=Companilactobacillus alimentarius DSM 20249 TaxID=1423720 RepID=A0A2K9HNP8_9LACO|nr:PTS lactose/cellobiose transporter subunit IIA [Companilactobacillus alimentarius]AUI71873.1 PTS cellobiose transporter subunit IIA [Companilactobacillus alimentarius DSM 20249]KRK76857.1 PTS system, cellobiose-specific IIA component [Companilactobacillus alimentarius DSM 20249]MDT6952404.1 PTS lactose/cellobiose transporter subunit IIA [Companilactobacillus alimentarius]GEO45126.1 PTS cellobiose transporter subunit IIA [Companilactobacillus alimentarius]